MLRRTALWSVAGGLASGANMLACQSAWCQVLPSPTASASADKGVTRQLRFTVTLSNTQAKYLLNQTLWLYMPVQLSATQDLLTVHSSAASEVISDVLGHSILKLSVNELSPLAQRVVLVTTRVMLYEKPRSSTLNNASEWLADEMYTEVQNASIVALAMQLKTDEPAKTAKNIYDWVSSNIAYAGYVADDLGALYALTQRKGDCTEYAFLVVALARACQIPSRMVGGYVTDRDAAPQANEYHNWAELYWGGAWHLVDAQKMNWLGPNSSYVAFRYFRGATLSPMGLAHRFQVEGEMRAAL